MSDRYRSVEWRKRRERFFIKHKKVCAACGTNLKINLHHLRYDAPFGSEPDSHLIPLCQKHHLEVHKYASMVNDVYTLEEATKIYLRMTTAGGNPLRLPRKRSKQKLIAHKKSQRKRPRKPRSNSYANRPSNLRKN